MYNAKIKSFTDLNTWKEGHKLVLAVYKVTSNFPKAETYALVDQMRRCIVSVTSNIAEGFSRKTNKEKVQFYHMSLGSLTEFQNQLLVAKDVGYIKKPEFDKLVKQSIEVSKLVNGLIRYAKKNT